VAIALGALNNWGQYAFKDVRDIRNPNADLAVLGTGYIALLALGIFLIRRDAALGSVNAPER
jgi:hypothetical protein